MVQIYTNDSMHSNVFVCQVVISLWVQTLLPGADLADFLTDASTGNAK